MSNKPLLQKRNTPERKSTAYSQRGRRPSRVVPLALGAVALTCASAAAAVEIFRDASGDRYAFEILKDEISKIG
jgi:hypothetical protein